MNFNCAAACFQGSGISTAQDREPAQSRPAIMDWRQPL